MNQKETVVNSVLGVFSQRKEQVTTFLCHVSPIQIIGCQFRRLPEDSTPRFTDWCNGLKPEQLYTQVFECINECFIYWSVVKTEISTSTLSLLCIFVFWSRSDILETWNKTTPWLARSCGTRLFACSYLRLKWWCSNFNIFSIIVLPLPISHIPCTTLPPFFQNNVQIVSI